MSLCIFLINLFCSYILPACCFHQRTCVAQSLVNRVLNETWTHSFPVWMTFGWSGGFYIGVILPFSPRVCLLWSALPLFDMFIVLCGHTLVLEWFWVSLTVFFLVCVCVCVVLNLLVVFFFFLLYVCTCIHIQKKWWNPKPLQHQCTVSSSLIWVPH